LRIRSDIDLSAIDLDLWHFITFAIAVVDVCRSETARMTLAIAGALASWDLLRIECACHNKLGHVQANRLACGDLLRARHSIIE
jgi:hypothetical protein